jgi:DNA-binding NtrC family response regulator
MIGDSLEWKRFLRKIVEVAYFTSCNILLTGASGTGKELTTNLIHAIDRRKEKGKLVLVDCTTISPELGGSEFYGHEKGAFTHAVQSRAGAFALADKGTIFSMNWGICRCPCKRGGRRLLRAHQAQVAAPQPPGTDHVAIFFSAAPYWREKHEIFFVL